ncbi:MAG: hypothetical protein JNK60_00890 [Acidobacteria bacterium]|nr:hypothetical protein [Acidobacteriota bacterium]
MVLRARALSVLATAALASFPSLEAVRPVSHYHDLVAGGFDASFRDGPFPRARFSSPTGLAFSRDGRVLYVADTGNHRIRAVLLDEGNRVETLAGTGERASRDGASTGAAFDSPLLLAMLSGDRLLVVEAGSRLRVVDLARKTVFTPKLEGLEMRGLFSVAPGADPRTLLAASPEQGALFRIDTETFEVTALPALEVLEPTALTVCDGQPVLADPGRERVVSLDASGSVTEIARISEVRALACPAGRLYALVVDRKAPLVVLAPERGDATPRSVWGGMLGNETEQIPGLFADAARPSGLVADPREDGRLLTSSPQRNIVVSVRDYGFASGWKSTGVQSTGLLDFAYPLRKPPHTVRLLVAGDSRSYSTTAPDVARWGGTNRMETLPKRLEMFLNAESALASGEETRFQVLTKGWASGEPLFLWPAADLPPLALAYDVDRAFVLVGPETANGFRVWFERPLDADGLPSRATDGEFLLRAPRGKIQKGRPERFFAACSASGLVKVQPSALVFADVERLAKDAAVRPQLVELLGEPLALLSRRLASAGRGFTLVYLPGGALLRDDSARDLWTEVASRYGLSFLDLSGEMAVFRASFGPLSEIKDYDHFSSDGNTLLGWLLARSFARAGLLSARAGADPVSAAHPRP